jgi:protein-disulfide isomerase
MRYFRIQAVTVVLLISAGVTGERGLVWAQSGPGSQSNASDVVTLQLELDQVRTELEDIRAELRLMRAFLLRQLGQSQPRRSSAPLVARVAVGDSPTLGMADAPLTLVEFSDYQCPFCRQFSEDTLPALKKNYIDTGKLRYVFRDFPIDQIHPQARKAAEAARCAGDEGKYWEMHGLLFQNQQGLHPERLQTYAEQLHLDTRAFGACLENAKYQARVQHNLTEGISAGVQGTPAFVLGKTRADGTVEGTLVIGLRSFNDFQQDVERLLGQKDEK